MGQYLCNRCHDIYDDSELLERYRFNRNKILYITDLLHNDLCPLTGSDAIPLMPLRLSATDTTILCPLSVKIQSREKDSATLYTIYCRLQIIGDIPCIIKIEWDFPSLVLVSA